MFKTLFSLVLAFVSFACLAQTEKIDIPMKKGKVYYEKSYTVNPGMQQKEIFKQVINWFKYDITNTEKTLLSTDTTTGEITGDATLKIETSSTGNYYLVNFAIKIKVQPGSYSFEAYRFYEKPTEVGITNEYSKIEYRWWDYRQGKPWSADDTPLFKGIASGTTGLMASLENEMASLQQPAVVDQPKFRVLAFYSTKVESDHVDFAKDAMVFYSKLGAKYGFAFDTTQNWNDLNTTNLKRYKVVVWLDDFPQSAQQRSDFEKYMDNGGGWIGFHVAGYNDETTHWPWFVNFLGAVFYNNNWPPLPAKLIVDDNTQPATKNLPKSYTAPLNEWYGWKPNPRDNKDIKVLLTLAPSNYPLGKKDIITEGDIPVVWTNTKYKMIYINMGHGDQNFDSAIQNQLFENALLWLGK